MNHKKILKEFVEIEKDKCLAGSGDDIYYINQINSFVIKQEKLLIELIKFVDEKQEAGR